MFISGSFVLAQDDDSDGIDNSVELIIGTDPLDSDSDNDGLIDGEEDINQDGVYNTSETDPLDADTDDDGISDGDEVSFSLNNRMAAVSVFL